MNCLLDIIFVNAADRHGTIFADVDFNICFSNNLVNDFAFLAERFKVSGGGIKNIVLHAAFLAAEEDAPICMRHLVRSAVGELRKNEIVVVREDLREYADLAFD